MLLALSFFFATALNGNAAQTASAAAPGQRDNSATPTFSSDVNLMVLHPTVKNSKGEFVSGLQKQDFQVFDDGQRQTIKLFQHEDVPVAVGLIVDSSGSMSGKRLDVSAATLTFVHASNPDDQMFVVNFNENVSFGLPPAKRFSAQASELIEALGNQPGGGRTALYDAVETGLVRLQKADRNKKVLIVISDGGDNASKHTLDQILQSAGRRDAIIYTIGLFDSDDVDRNPGVLKRIAHATGGEAFFPPEPGALMKICKRIAEDIRNQYTIGYSPSEQAVNGRYRTIRVVASTRGNRKLNVRTRDGYIASTNRVNK